MKAIDKEGLKEIIDGLFIEDIKITRSAEFIDNSTLQGKSFMPKSTGEITITVKGVMLEPDKLDK